MIEFDEDEISWPQKYRPRKIEDVILPERLKAVFQNFVNSEKIPNLLLSGQPGIGKTTIALAMCNELDADCYVINGSLDGGIDNLRVNVQGYASSVSLNGKRKYVIIDEADYLTHATQPALRNFMEEFSKNCGFILTCNYVTRILPAIRSRCTTVDFSLVDEEEQIDLAASFFERACLILKNENVKFNKTVLAEVINENFPDFRKTLNQLQGYANRNGTIDSGILASVAVESDVKSLFDSMSKQDLNAVRKWSAENSFMNISDVFSTMYGMADDYLKPSGIAQMLVTMRDYEYSSAFVLNQEINLAAGLITIMSECEFK